jgi:hypothetical protein
MTSRRRAHFGFAFLAVLALCGAPSRADDSTATLGAGGLALEKTDKIALVSEDLYLSPTAVTPRRDIDVLFVKTHSNR